MSWVFGQEVLVLGILARSSRRTLKTQQIFLPVSLHNNLIRLQSFGYFGKKFLFWVFWQEVQDEPSKLRHFTYPPEAYQASKEQRNPEFDTAGLEVQQYRGTDSRLSDGEASPSIGNLTRMQYLTIGIHASSGELPKELGMLTDLKVLWASDNELTGRIPDLIGAKFPKI
ncbi:hypothetical protein OIU77_002495 [Salix suchowensis]|uniref:Uncharacterized protein n=1 Tax=Salix suchowensis TaxID=1278906 RepID=A0ABQ9AWR1_9ROSI|nr:hypothetical protein OIU77_002495 [Salix suchowensis]